MEIERSLSDLAASLASYRIALAKRTVNAGASNVYDVIDFSAGGTVFCSVSADDLYDADGNLFTDDL